MERSKVERSKVEISKDKVMLRTKKQMERSKDKEIDYDDKHKMERTKVGTSQG